MRGNTNLMSFHFGILLWPAFGLRKSRFGFGKRLVLFLAFGNFDPIEENIQTGHRTMYCSKLGSRMTIKYKKQKGFWVFERFLIKTGTRRTLKLRISVLAKLRVISGPNLENFRPAVDFIQLLVRLYRKLTVSWY